MQEIAKYKDLQTGSLLSAARCLRALREMKSEAAVDSAIEMLATLNPKAGPSQYQRVVLSEATFYLSDNFQVRKARDAFYRFVKDSPEKWRQGRAWFGVYRPNASSGEFTHDSYFCIGLGQTRPTRDWQWSNSKEDALSLNVFYGLGRLVDLKDPGIGDFLAESLSYLPYQYAVLLEYVSINDGFTPNTYVYFSPRATDKSADFAGGSQEVCFEPKARARMLVMRWLRDLNHRKAVDAIQPLLRSTQKDERDFALLVLESLAGTGTAGTSTGNVGEAQPDVVLLRNGDLLTGQILNETFTVKTSYAELNFRTEEIASVQVQTASSRTDLMELRVGDKLSGIIQDNEIRLKLKAGGDTVIKKADIDNVRFGQRGRNQPSISGAVRSPESLA